jgi:hypothetical protein
MGEIDPRKAFLIRLAFAPLIVPLIAIAVASRDWKLILFVGAAIVWFGWDLFHDWSAAFPDRAKSLPHPLRRVTAPRSHAQKVAAGIVFSLPLLAVVILAFGLPDTVFLAIVIPGYGLAVLHLLWVIRQEGWSGTKRARQSDL